MIDTLFLFFFFFFFNDTATTEIYTLSLHDALPIFVLEETRELSRLHAIDSRLVFLNDQVNARVRERLLHVRLLPPEIPADDPIVFYEETQVLCRQMS